MRILVVSSYPPRHCGIGAYARDQVAHLRADAHEVIVLSPPDGDGDVRAPFVGGGAFRKAARIGTGYERIVVHFQPALYYPPRKAFEKVLTSASLLWLVLRRRNATELMIHESDPPMAWRPDYLLLRLAFRLAGTLSFHTEAERRAFEQDYGQRRGQRVRVVPHVATTVLAPGSVSRQEARVKLGLPPAVVAGGPMLVTPGFLQPSKGLDRALDAFERVFVSGGDPGAGGSAPGASLYLVGSVREDTAENRSYAARVRERSAAVAGAHLIERFVPEEEFDLWVAAADRVVLPYRRSWSSGVLARAQELGTPAIVCDVGGLAEQASEADEVVEGDEGLVEAFERLRVRARGSVARGGSGR